MDPALTWNGPGSLLYWMNWSIARRSQHRRKKRTNYENNAHIMVTVAEIEIEDFIAEEVDRTHAEPTHAKVQV